jgi:hypothetical protein
MEINDHMHVPGNFNPEKDLWVQIGNIYIYICVCVFVFVQDHFARASDPCKKILSLSILREGEHKQWISPSQTKDGHCQTLCSVICHKIAFSYPNEDIRLLRRRTERDKCFV